MAVGHDTAIQPVQGCCWDTANGAKFWKRLETAEYGICAFISPSGLWLHSISVAAEHSPGTLINVSMTYTTQHDEWPGN